MKFYIATITTAFFLICNGLTAQLIFEEDINLEPADSNPFHLSEHNGKLYFQAEDPSLGEELHVYDIASGETTLELDLKPGYETGGAGYMTGHDDKLFLMGRVSNFRELVKYDLITKDYTVVRTSTGQPAENAVLLTKFDNKIFMQLDDDDIGQELGIYDFSTEELVFHDLNPEISGFPSSFEIGGGKLWFSARDTFDTSQLWAYDQETDQMARVDYILNATEHPRNIRNIKYLDGEVYFMGDSQGRNREMWIYNEADNTLNEGPEPSPGSPNSFPFGFTKLQDKVYFSARGFNTVGTELYAIDIATKELSVVEDINPDGDGSPSGFFVQDEKLYFSAAEDGITRSMYVYDPVTDQSTALASIDNDGEFNSLSPTFINEDLIVITAISKDYGRELFLYDLQNDNIELLADVHTGNSGSSPYDLTEINGQLYMRAEEFASGDQVWRYDPSSGIASLLTDPGQSVRPRGFAELDGKVYFGGYHPDIIYGLLYLDLSDDSLHPTGYVTPSNLNHINNITTFNNKVYFTSNDPVHENELFVYDPTTDEATLVVDINNDPKKGTTPQDFRIINNQLYFTALQPSGGREFYRMDGATGTVEALPKVNPDPEKGATFRSIITIGDDLYFSAFLSRTELYKYNSTTNEIEQLTTVEANIIENITAYDNKLFCSARYNTGGQELYSYDLVTGTFELELDIAPGNISSSPKDLIVFNDLLYFSADLEEYGRELWTYDGVTAQIVADVRPGSAPADIDNLILFNDKLYFTADDGLRGRELWSIAECLNVIIDTEPQIDNKFGNVDLTVQGGTLPYSYLWEDGTTTEDLIDVEAGSYVCTVTDATGCISVVEVVVDFVTGVQGINIDDLRIFPNPSDKLVNISWKNASPTSDFNIQIVNTQGTIMHTKSISSGNNGDSVVDVSEWIPGIYFMFFRTKEETIIRKIVVQ